MANKCEHGYQSIDGVPHCPWCRIRELETELADWQRMRNEAMAVATSNRARINELEDELAGARTIIQRCYDDPGVAYNETEQAAMCQLWNDVAAWLADVKDGPHNVVASAPETKGDENGK